jgi:hypothetical protein
MKRMGFVCSLVVVLSLYAAPAFAQGSAPASSPAVPSSQLQPLAPLLRGKFPRVPMPQHPGPLSD